MFMVEDLTLLRQQSVNPDLQIEVLIPIRIPDDFFMEINKLILKCMRISKDLGG